MVKKTQGIEDDIKKANINIKELKDALEQYKANSWYNLKFKMLLSIFCLLKNDQLK